MGLPEIIGVLGAITVIVAYGLLSTGRLAAGGARYQLMNIAGTVGILISLFAQWNLASFIANVAWLVIGLVGLARIFVKRRAA